MYNPKRFKNNRYQLLQELLSRPSRPIGRVRGGGKETRFSHEGERRRTKAGKDNRKGRKKYGLQAVKQDVKKLREDLNCAAKPSKLISKYGETGTFDGNGKALGKMMTYRIKARNETTYNYGLTKLQFWDETAAGYVIKSANDAKIEKICIPYQQHKLSIRNRQMPTDVRLYLVAPKQDTTLEPITAYTNGLAKSIQGYNVKHSQDKRTFLTDSPDFNSHWKILFKDSFHLEPGELYQTKTKGVINKETHYNPNYANSNVASSYSKQLDLHWIVQIVGSMAQDVDTIDNIHWGNCQVDYIASSQIQYEYNGGGVPTTSIYFNDDSGNTASIGVSTQWIVDNGDALITGP